MSKDKKDIEGVPSKSEKKPRGKPLSRTRANAVHIPPNIEKPVEYLTFIKWVATPSTERDPETMGELAKRIGVHPDTLTDWKKIDGFWDEVRKEIKNYFKQDTGIAIQALKRTVLKRGSAPETKLFLQVVDFLKEDNEIAIPEALRKALEKINQKI